jgi:hypothetical protein
MSATEFAFPTPPRTKRKNAEQLTTILTHRRLEVNPKASAAWMRQLSGNASLCGATLSALQCVCRNPILLHEIIQRLSRNSSKARKAVALQSAVIEAPNDSLLADLTDLCRFASRENGLRRFSLPLKPK